MTLNHNVINRPPPPHTHTHTHTHTHHTHTHTHTHTIFCSMHSTEAAGCSPLRAGLQQSACCWTSSFFHTSLVLGGLYPPSCHAAILLATIHTCSSLPWQLAQAQISPLRLCTGDWHTLCSSLIRIWLPRHSSLSLSPLQVHREAVEPNTFGHRCPKVKTSNSFHRSPVLCFPYSILCVIPLYPQLIYLMCDIRKHVLW